MCDSDIRYQFYFKHIKAYRNCYRSDSYNFLRENITIWYNGTKLNYIIFTK